MAILHTDTHPSIFQLLHLDQFTNGLAYVGEKAREAIIDGYIFNEPTWLSRSIENFTASHLPPATAKVASTFIQVLPVVILCYPLPTYINFVASSINNGRDILSDGGRYRHEEVNKLQIGAETILGAIYFPALLENFSKGNYFSAIFDSVVIALAGLAYLQSGIFSDIAASVQEIASKILHSPTT